MSDIAKIKKLGFKVKDNFSFGLNKTINWYLKNFLKLKNIKHKNLIFIGKDDYYSKKFINL